jgi:hypothetical protein
MWTPTILLHASGSNIIEFPQSERNFLPDNDIIPELRTRRISLQLSLGEIIIKCLYFPAARGGLHATGTDFHEFSDRAPAAT